MEKKRNDPVWYKKQKKKPRFSAFVKWMKRPGPLPRSDYHKLHRLTQGIDPNNRNERDVWLQGISPKKRRK